MKLIGRTIACICLCMTLDTYTATRAAPKQEASPQAVLTQFFSIVAHSLEFAAQNGDKDAQMHALAGIVQNISNIVDLASKSPENAEIVLNTLRDIKNKDLKTIFKKVLAKPKGPFTPEFFEMA